MAAITVIGSFVVDHVARMDKFPSSGETVLGSSVAVFPGGKGANQCISAARLGADTEMVGMLGKDEYGRMFRRLLQQEGIAADHVFSCELPTSSAFVEINAEGQNRICVIPSANHRFGFAELERIDGLLKKTKLVVLQLEMRLDVTKEIIRRAHRYGATILLNPAPAADLENDVLCLVDYLTPNETELSCLTGLPVKTDEQIAVASKTLLSSGVGTVVATLGARGALIVQKNGCTFVPAYSVNAVDTVAAGDSFTGALAVALTEGKTIFEAVCFANATAALTVQKHGAIPSLHYREDVERFMINAARRV